MTDLTLSIENWAAWISPASARNLPGIGPAALDEHIPDSTGRIRSLEPEIGFLSANQRRRLTPLSRLIVDTYHRANGHPSDGLQIPSILCSTYGEHVRNTDLILDISTNSEISPTAFSLSVHNAVAGLISIFYGNEAPCLAMATNKSGVSMALVQAYSMLSENSQVSLAIYDGPVHESYRDAVTDSDETAAITLILSRESSKKDRLHVRHTVTNSKTKALSPKLEIVEIVKFLQVAENQLNSETTGIRSEIRLVLGDWTWSLLRKEQKRDQAM